MIIIANDYFISGCIAIGQLAEKDCRGSNKLSYCDNSWKVLTLLDICTSQSLVARRFLYFFLSHCKIYDHCFWVTTTNFSHDCTTFTWANHKSDVASLWWRNVVLLSCRTTCDTEAWGNSTNERQRDTSVLHYWSLSLFFMQSGMVSLVPWETATTTSRPTGSTTKYLNLYIQCGVLTRTWAAKSCCWTCWCATAHAL